MSRRKNNKLTPMTLPLLRDDLAIVEYENDPEFGVIKRLDVPDDLSDLLNGELWWVSKNMTLLALNASQTLDPDYVTDAQAFANDIKRQFGKEPWTFFVVPPDSDFLRFAPGESGVIFFEGGTGLEVMDFHRDDFLKQAQISRIEEAGGLLEFQRLFEERCPKVEVFGLWWMKISRVTTVTGLIGPDKNAPSGFNEIQDAMFFNANTAIVYAQMFNLCATAFLLATQENIGRAREEESSLRRAWVPKNEKKNPSTVVVAELRRTKKYREEKHDTSGEKKHYSHSFAVRGHWRNQAWGPNHSKRRPTWVETYLKGEGEIVLKSKVNVWKR